MFETLEGIPVTVKSNGEVAGASTNPFPSLSYCQWSNSNPGFGVGVGK